MKLTLLLISLFAFQYLNAQDTLIVYFKDKRNSEFVQLSERAIARRKKNNVQLDHRDKQVNQEYIDFMKSEGTILNVSRWLNGLTLVTNSTLGELSSKYDFIKEIKVSQSIRPVKGLNKFGVQDETKAAVYGAAEGQINQINLDCLHDMGYDGAGVFIAVIDAGYSGMDTIPYFDSIYLENRVIDTYNFIAGNSDVYMSSNHGTLVSSCIVGEKGGTDSLSTTAVEVDIALYLSENSASETIIEEFDLVLALERSDSIGADIATISLGYVHFDDPSQDHPFSDMDGQTTVAAIGVNAAVSKGILVLCSAGNSGPEPIATPCDSDSCLCIGAVKTDHTYANFSSLGPSADGQIKPDIMARGKNATVVTDDGFVTMGNGTSFSTPIMAGAMACLMQANPQSTVEQLKFAIRQSGSTFTSPNDSMGYGIPDMCDANGTLGIIADLADLELNSYSIYPNPTKGFITISGIDAANDHLVFELINVLGEQVEIRNAQKMNQDYVLDIQKLSNGVYILQVSNGTEKLFTKRIIKN